MIFKYLSFSISIVFLSFIVGMILTALIRKTNFYNNQLSNLNFIKSENTNKIIGILFIKWIVRNTFFKFLNQKLKIDRNMKVSDLQIIRNEMTKAEIDHLFAFIFTFIFVVIAFFFFNYL